MLLKLIRVAVYQTEKALKEMKCSSDVRQFQDQCSCINRIQLSRPITLLVTFRMRCMSGSCFEKRADPSGKVAIVIVLKREVFNPVLKHETNVKVLKATVK